MSILKNNRRLLPPAPLVCRQILTTVRQNPTIKVSIRGVAGVIPECRRGAAAIIAPNAQKWSAGRSNHMRADTKTGKSVSGRR